MDHPGKFVPQTCSAGGVDGSAVPAGGRKRYQAVPFHAGLVVPKLAMVLSQKGL